MEIGGILHFCAGWFQTTSPIQIDYTYLPIILEGEGILPDYGTGGGTHPNSGGTYIEYANASGGNAIELKNVPDTVKNYAHLTIRDMTVACHGDYGAYNAVLNLQKLNNIDIENVEVHHGKNFVSTYGLCLGNGSAGNDGTLTNVLVDGRCNYSIYTSQAWLTMIGVDVNSFSTYGIYCTSPTKILGSRIGTSMYLEKGDIPIAGIYAHNCSVNVIDVYDESNNANAGANYISYISNGLLAKLWLIGCSNSPFMNNFYNETNSGMVIPISSVFSISTPISTGDEFWFNWCPRIAHPDTSNWGTNMTGTMWYDTTYNNYEYWNGTDCIYWNATGVGVQP